MPQMNVCDEWQLPAKAPVDVDRKIRCPQSAQSGVKSDPATTMRRSLTVYLYQRLGRELFPNERDCH